MFYLLMGDFLYGQFLKGAGRTQSAIDLKFSLLDPSFKASFLHFLYDWRAFHKCPAEIHDVPFL